LLPTAGRRGTKTWAKTHKTNLKINKYTPNTKKHAKTRKAKPKLYQQMPGHL